MTNKKQSKVSPVAKSKRKTQSDQLNSVEASVSKRIDAAHALASSSEVARNKVAEEPFSPKTSSSEPLDEKKISTELLEQMHAQADQIRLELQSQVEDLERREAEVNSRCAQLDTEVRRIRLWLENKQFEIEQQQKNVKAEDVAVEERLNRVIQVEKKLSRRNLPKQELLQKGISNQEQTTSLADHSKTIKQLQQQIEKQNNDYLQLQEKYNQLCEQSSKNVTSEAEVLKVDATDNNDQEKKQKRRARLENAAVDQRQANLQRAEKILAQQQQELKAEQKQVALQRDELSLQMATIKKQQEKENQKAQAEIARERMVIRKQFEAIETRQVAQDRFQEELTAMQRETLEMRLAMEELWLQLSGAMAPVMLTQELSKLRAKLAEHYQHASEQLEKQKEELQLIASRIAEKTKSIEKQREELKQWAQRQHTDIEQQAARLVAREQELDRQENHYRQQSGLWQQERSELQLEIQQLLNQLRNDIAFKASA